MVEALRSLALSGKIVNNLGENFETVVGAWIPDHVYMLSATAQERNRGCERRKSNNHRYITNLIFMHNMNFIAYESSDGRNEQKDVL